MAASLLDPIVDVGEGAKHVLVTTGQFSASRQGKMRHY
jgi:hypothetical protein